MSSNCCNANVRIACGSRSYEVSEEEKLNLDPMQRGKTYYYYCAHCKKPCDRKESINASV